MFLAAMILVQSMMQSRETRVSFHTICDAIRKAITKEETMIDRAAGASLRDSKLLGSTPLLACPRYHFPMLVNPPPTLTMVALMPTFDTDDRKAPNNEYRSIKGRRSKYSADNL